MKSTNVLPTFGNVKMGSNFLNTKQHKVIICGISKDKKIYKVRCDEWGPNAIYNLSHVHLRERLKNKQYTHWCIQKELYKIY